MSTKPRRLNFSEKSDEKGHDSPTNNKRKRSLDSFSSPKKKGKKDDAFVTPDKRTRRVLDKTSEQPEEEYVPTYIYKNIDYKRKGEGKIDDATRKVFQLIVKNFSIPKDLEQNRKYGPKSGMTFEEHVIRAYKLKMLEPKEESSSPEGGRSIDICTHCATEGHTRDDCSQLI